MDMANQIKIINQDDIIIFIDKYKRANDFPDVGDSIKLLWGNPYRFYFGKQVKNHQLSNRNRMQKGLKTSTDNKADEHHMCENHI